MLNTIRQPSTGTATPLLIVHGLYGSGRNWGVIAKRLSDRGPVIAVDQRNHGNSPWADSHDYFDMAADLAAVIEAEGQAMDIVGHSMGGKAAMVLALTRPDLVRRLVVADIAPVAYTHNPVSNITAMRGVDLAHVTNRAEAAAQLDVEPALRDFFLQSLDMKEKRWRLNLDVLEAFMPQIVGWPDVRGQFQGKTLFLSGALSDYVLPDHRAAIKAHFPNAIFAKIPGAGHWLHADKPREFEAAVRAFLGA